MREGYGVANHSGELKASAAEGTGYVCLYVRGWDVKLSAEEARWLARRLHRLARRVEAQNP